MSITQQTPFGRAAVTTAALLALAASTAYAQGETTYQGKPVRMGNGTAHTVVRTDASGNPASVAIVLTETALEGLPSGDKVPMANLSYKLRMPAKGPKTVFDHVVINWEPHGHPPPKVYDVPHFDFHFYTIGNRERTKIRFKNEGESGDPANKPAAEFMPAGYILPPGTAVPQMGVHAINPASAEFQGQPFTATFIYGYHAKKLAFVEPMASLAFLQSKTPLSAQVPRPASYSKAGAYPSAYSIKYDEATKTYAVTLEDLR